MPSATELWRPVTGKVAGYPYEVSNLGRVRSLNREPRARYGRVLAATNNTYGYSQVSLRRGGKSKCCQVHLLVAEAFIGSRPMGHETNHRNGIKTDNRLGNLEWVTPYENHHHAVNMGLRDDPKGEENPAAKLTDNKVMHIREQYAAGATQQQLANECNVGTTTIGRVVRGETWKHVGG